VKSLFGGSGAAREVPWIVFCIYDEARQLHDLERMLIEWEAQPVGRRSSYFLMASPATLAQLMETVRPDAVDGLIETLIDASSRTFEMDKELCRSLAASCLARRGSKGIRKTERAIRIVRDPSRLIEALRADPSDDARQAIDRLPQWIKERHSQTLLARDGSDADVSKLARWPAIAQGSLPRTWGAIPSAAKATPE
jgi:hypothetical protein